MTQQRSRLFVGNAADSNPGHLPIGLPMSHYMVYLRWKPCLRGRWLSPVCRPWRTAAYTHSQIILGKHAYCIYSYYACVYMCIYIVYIYTNRTTNNIYFTLQYSVIFIFFCKNTNFTIIPKLILNKTKYVF